MNVEQVPVAELDEHPANPRQGDVGAIVESIQQNGWYGTIVAQRSTRQVLVGNHRLRAARALEMGEVPVMWVDVDDETALRILLADNRTSDLASYDDQALANLLIDLAQQTEGELAGTGYSGDALDQLLADLTSDAGIVLGDTPPPNLPPDRANFVVEMSLEQHRDATRLLGVVVDGEGLPPAEVLVSVLRTAADGG